MFKAPPVRLLQSLNPTNAGTGEDILRYEGLQQLATEYALTNHQRSEDVWDSRPGSLEEESRARQLASEYLLRTAAQLNANAVDQNLWADRFTQASIELFGEPDPDEAARLIAQEYRQFAEAQGSSVVPLEPLRLLLDTYQPITEARPATFDAEDIAREREVIARYGAAILAEYSPLFDLVDTAGKDIFGPHDLYELCSKALRWLGSQDKEWRKWSCELYDGTYMSITVMYQMLVGDKRPPASAHETKGTLGHEIPGHALRIKNGYQTGDKQLGIGLPGSTIAEEGNSTVNEAALTGKLPDRITDRYIDTALALGTLDGAQRNRHQLARIGHARNITRAAMRGEGLNASPSPAQAWSHVDRIYKGGPGDGNSKRQAVFTRGSAYYPGYKSMAQHIGDLLDSGHTATRIFHYFSLGRFNPLDARHVRRVTDATGIKPLLPL